MKKFGLAALLLIVILTALLMFGWVSSNISPVLLPENPPTDPAAIPVIPPPPVPERVDGVVNPPPEPVGKQKVEKAKLQELFQKGQAGDTEALKQFCFFVKGEDLYDLSGFEVSEDLRASCAELK